MIIGVRLEPNGTIYIDKNLRDGIDYNEPPYNFKLMEINDNFYDCEPEDFDDALEFDKTKYERRKNRYKAITEYNELKNWFDNIYQYQEQKYRRLHTLQLLCDNGTTPYDMLIWLYKEAEVKRKRIQELEGLINE